MNEEDLERFAAEKGLTLASRKHPPERRDYRDEANQLAAKHGGILVFCEYESNVRPFKFAPPAKLYAWHLAWNGKEWGNSAEYPSLIAHEHIVRADGSEYMRHREKTPAEVARDRAELEHRIHVNAFLTISKLVES